MCSASRQQARDHVLVMAFARIFAGRVLSGVTRGDSEAVVQVRCEDEERKERLSVVSSSTRRTSFSLHEIVSHHRPPHCGEIKRRAEQVDEMYLRPSRGLRDATSRIHSA